MTDDISPLSFGRCERLRASWLLSLRFSVVFGRCARLRASWPLSARPGREASPMHHIACVSLRGLRGPATTLGPRARRPNPTELRSECRERSRPPRPLDQPRLAGPACQKALLRELRPNPAPGRATPPKKMVDVRLFFDFYLTRHDPPDRVRSGVDNPGDVRSALSSFSAESPGTPCLARHPLRGGTAPFWVGGWFGTGRGRTASGPQTLFSRNMIRKILSAGSSRSR